MAIEQIIGQPSLEKNNENPPAEQKIEKIEVRVEQKEIGSKEKETNRVQERSGESFSRVASPVQDVQKQREIAIDNILADGLSEVFLKMNPVQQKEFKTKGEETAKKISVLLEKTKFKVSKIIGLIKKWLQLIPGVNKFFLEQETKLKADKIINLKNK